MPSKGDTFKMTLETQSIPALRTSKSNANAAERKRSQVSLTHIQITGNGHPYSGKNSHQQHQEKGKQMIFNYINILSNALRNGIIGLLGSPSLNQAAEEIYTAEFTFSLEFMWPVFRKWVSGSLMILLVHNLTL